MQSNYYSGEEKRIAQGEEEAKKRAMGALGAAQRERERERRRAVVEKWVISLGHSVRERDEMMDRYRSE